MSPADSLQILEQYGVVILPALAIAEQIGIPLPAVPALPPSGLWSPTVASVSHSCSARFP
jgi:hypothetical protein